MIKFLVTWYSRQEGLRLVTAVLLVCLTAPLFRTAAQTSLADGGHTTPAESNGAGSSPFRIEKIAVPAGAELITVFARGDTGAAMGPTADVPLISVVRDTLGDRSTDND